MQLYRTASSDPKSNAQRNLEGRTHYVDDDNLRFHHSHVLSTRVFADGLLFGVVTSDVKDMDTRRRGFRYTLFDVFGNAVRRDPADVALVWFTSSSRARKAMADAVAAIDVHGITLMAADRAEWDYLDNLRQLRATVAKLAANATA